MGASSIMDSEERARKYLIERFGGKWSSEDCSALQTQFDEAVAEEFARGAIDQQHRCAKHCEQQRQEGFAAAREKAARIANEHAKIKGAHIHKGFKFCVEEVAERIRAMEPDK